MKKPDDDLWAMRELCWKLEAQIDELRQKLVITQNALTDSKKRERALKGKEHEKLLTLAAHYWDRQGTYVVQQRDRLRLSITRHSRFVSRLKNKPLRVCRRVVYSCDLCGRDITRGERYYDGGLGARAHQECVTPVKAAKK